MLLGYGAGGPPAVDLSGGLGSHSLKRALLCAGGTRVGSNNAYSLKMRHQSSMRSSRVLGKALHEGRAGRALGGAGEAPFKHDDAVMALAPRCGV